jgi:hypothetical protein
VFGSVELNYKLLLTIIGLAIFSALSWLADRPRPPAQLEPGSVR